MNNPRLTLYGMMQYMPSLFDGVILPPGYNRDIMIDEIIERSGDLYPYYQIPDRLKDHITHWFESRYENLNRIYRALYAEYNPIENYDRQETSMESPEMERTLKETGSDQTVSNSNASTRTISIDRSEGLRSAYDSYEYSPETLTTSNGTDSARSDSSVNQTSDRTRTEGVVEKGKKLFESHVHGNVGVTTNQEMIKAELDLREIDLYEMIAEQFENKFLVQIY